MTNPMISAAVFALAAILLQGSASNIAFYIHPDHARQEDKARVPKWSTIFVRHHNFTKWGGALLSWACFALAQAIKPLGATVYYAALVGAFIGGGLFVMSLSWRMHGVIDGNRGPDDRQS